MRIITSSSELNQKFFIDCPVQTVMEGEKIIRMEIPKELAMYIYKLQSDVESLKKKLERKEK